MVCFLKQSPDFGHNSCNARDFTTLAYICGKIRTYQTKVFFWVWSEFPVDTDYQGSSQIYITYIVGHLNHFPKVSICSMKVLKRTFPFKGIVEGSGHALQTSRIERFTFGIQYKKLFFGSIWPILRFNLTNSSVAFVSTWAMSHSCTCLVCWLKHFGF